MFFTFLSNTDCSRVWFVMSYPGTFCEWPEDILPDLEACVLVWATAIFILPPNVFRFLVVELDLWYLFLVHFASSGRTPCQILKYVYQNKWPQKFLLNKCFPLSWAIPAVVEFNLWYLILVHFASGGKDILPDLEACVPGWATAIFIALFLPPNVFRFLVQYRL